MRAHAQDTVLEPFAAFAARDAETAEAVLHPELELCDRPTDELARRRGPYRGHAGFTAAEATELAARARRPGRSRRLAGRGHGAVLAGPGAAHRTRRRAVHARQGPRERDGAAPVPPLQAGAEPLARHAGRVAQVAMVEGDRDDARARQTSAYGARPSWRVREPCAMRRRARRGPGGPGA